MDVIEANLLPLVARSLIVLAVIWAVIAGIRCWRGMDTRTAISRSIAEALIALGVVLIWGVTLAPVDVLMPGVVPVHPPINLVPVLPLLAGFADGADLRNSVANVVGNVVLFAPIGFGLRWRFGLRVWSILLIAAVGSVAVEVVQALSDQMRSSDINDVILNSLGAVAGAWAFMGARRLLDGRIDVDGPITAQTDSLP